VKVIIPLSPDDLGGRFVIGDADRFEILAARDKAVLIEFNSLPAGVLWFDTFDLMYCQRQHDPEVIKVVRNATEEERREFRVPLWIQDEEIPECCGRPMFFVGQIDDDVICTERPPDAKMWWHDRASFYVFSCSQCLESKVVGQQF